MAHHRPPLNLGLLLCKLRRREQSLMSGRTYTDEEWAQWMANWDSAPSTATERWAEHGVSASSVFLVLLISFLLASSSILLLGIVLL